MKARFLSLAPLAIILVAIAGLVGQAAVAGDCCAKNDCCENACDCAPSCCADALCNDGCCDDCCDQGGFYGEAEVIWFKYGRSDGARVGNDAGEEAPFDYETSPRITVGYTRCDGLGARVRYWEFDHNAPSANGGLERLDVDVYTFDFEVFETIALNCDWELEVAFGLRYTDFVEIMNDDAERRLNGIHGVGGVASAELRRAVNSGYLFVRARLAMMQEDKDIFNSDSEPPDQLTLLDVNVGVWELAIGYMYVRDLDYGAYAFARASVEWQQWENYTSSFEDTATTEDFGGPSDANFFGFGFSVGIAR